MKGLIAKFPPKYYEMPSKYRDSFYLANASFFDSVNWYLHKAYEVVFPELVEKMMSLSGMDEKLASQKVRNLIGILDQCDHLLDARYPVNINDGDVEVVRGFKVKHGSYLGFPSDIVGVRFSPDLTRDELKGLGILSTHRSWAMGVKKTGSFVALKIDVNEYQEEVLKFLIQQYTSKYLKGGSKKMFIEPDINCDPFIYAWMCNKLEDSECTDLAACQGAFFGINYFLNNELIASKLAMPKGVSGKTFIIQGFGKIGSNLSVYLQSAGAICVGVKERHCHVHNKNGLDVHEILTYKKQKGDLIGFELAKPVDDYEIFKEECDVLILAAKQKSLLCHFAKSIKAKVIVEAAYHPITPSAYASLLGRSKIVLPDLLMCGGSAVAANQEERFGKNHHVIPREVLETIDESRMEKFPSTYKIANVIINRSQELLGICEKYNLGYDFKTSAFIMSINNIFEEIFTSRRF